MEKHGDWRQQQQQELQTKGSAAWNVIHPHTQHMSGSDDTGLRRRLLILFWYIFMFLIRAVFPSRLLWVIHHRADDGCAAQSDRWKIGTCHKSFNHQTWESTMRKYIYKKRPWIKSNQMKNKNKSWSFSNCQLCGAMIGLCGAPLNTSGHSLVHIGDRTTIYSRCVSFQGNHLFDRETIPRAHCITPKGDCLFLFLMGLLLL